LPARRAAYLYCLRYVDAPVYVDRIAQAEGVGCVPVFVEQAPAVDQDGIAPDPHNYAILTIDVDAVGFYFDRLGKSFLVGCFACRQLCCFATDQHEDETDQNG